ncbi:hypothetical protein CXB51_010272 [Gossypium anomalum]|uniref:Uncharacterized protein n=1 Tax=Gossypium anomalum TaxID=47600 RepID=A0A8J6D203_9ROSI|nr:hypothetical protein CXB51_010272 [Gossypium anomalum]
MVKTAFIGDKRSINQMEVESSAVETIIESAPVKLAIDSHDKLGHLTEEVKKLEVGDPKMSKWRSENSMIIVWLINSMEASIGFPTINDVWDIVKDTYSNLENASQNFELKIKLWKAR